MRHLLPLIPCYTPWVGAFGRVATSAMAFLHLVGCYVCFDDDETDTGEVGAQFDVFVDAPGLGNQTNDVGSVWRYEDLTGPACAPSEIAGFTGLSDESGFYVFLAVSDVGAEVLPSPDGVYPVIVEFYGGENAGLQTGTLDVVESTDERLEVHVLDGVFCDIEGLNCRAADGPVVIRMEGPRSPYDGASSITQHSRLLDPVSGDRLCTPLDFVR